MASPIEVDDQLLPDDMLQLVADEGLKLDDDDEEISKRHQDVINLTSTNKHLFMRTKLGRYRRGLRAFNGDLANQLHGMFNTLCVRVEQSDPKLKGSAEFPGLANLAFVVSREVLSMFNPLKMPEYFYSAEGIAQSNRRRQRLLKDRRAATYRILNALALPKNAKYKFEESYDEVEHSQTLYYSAVSRQKSLNRFDVIDGLYTVKLALHFVHQDRCDRISLYVYSMMPAVNSRLDGNHWDDCQFNIAFPGKAGVPEEIIKPILAGDSNTCYTILEGLARENATLAPEEDEGAIITVAAAFGTLFMQDIDDHGYYISRASSAFVDLGLGRRCGMSHCN